MTGVTGKAARCAPRQRGSSVVAVLFAAALVALSHGPLGSPLQAQVDYELPPIDYLNAPVNDAVARLQTQVASGETQLEFTEPGGYLHSLLEKLEIPISSQVLVFSKTSFQLTKISPRRPRALYFNDTVYVGTVQNGDVIEIAAMDAAQGAIFYTLEQRPKGAPTFERQTHNCLVCHGSSHTEGVPGVFVRSVYPDRSGHPVLSAGTFRTDYTSSLRERWGGWYVTGTHGAQRHMGNTLLRSGAEPDEFDVESGANVTDLRSRLNLSAYASPHSDIVALMVLEHQVAVHNRLTAANYSARITQRDAKIMNEALGHEEGTETESTRRRLDSAAERVVDVLLLVDEEKLVAPVAGTSSFATEFTQRGPTDSRGRGLRQLDLQTRLFRYPCSYLIYSEAFDRLPAPLLDRVWQRLWEVLAGANTAEKYQHLTPEIRQDILAILRETKPNLPASWR